MLRYWLAAALLLVASFAPACAQSGQIERVVKVAPGRDVRVGIYTNIRPDCSSGPLPAIRLARPPAHGAVTVRRAMLKATNVRQCLAIDAPALVAFYRAPQNFSGADEFELEITFSGGHKQIQDFRVTSGADSGQGI